MALKVIVAAMAFLFFAEHSIVVTSHSMTIIESKSTASVTESVDASLRRRRKESLSSSSPRTATNEKITLPKQQHLLGGDNDPATLHESKRASSTSLADQILEPRIIGGFEATPGRYPYTVSLTYFGSHLCGGSLIAPDIVLSASHCAGYATTVELGRHDRSSSTPPSDYESIDVAYEIKHPSYDESIVNNDFMLIKLIHPSEDPSPSLITLNTNPNFPVNAGDPLIVMGWGDTNADEDISVLSSVLLEAELNYVPNEQCQEAKGTVGDNNDFVSYANMITDNMMCARDDVDDTCQGDSGSPMVVRGEDPSGKDDIQVGVVSWGIGCASPIFPGVYSRVSSQMEWIKDVVCEHSQLAPESFGCDEASSESSDFPTTFPLPEEEEEGGVSPYLTLEVSLDGEPQEFSWIVSSLTGQKQVLATVPPGFYTGYSNFTFHHRLKVDPTQFYKISLRDNFGDGLKGYVAVYRGATARLTNLIMYEPLFYDPDTMDAKSVDHAFYAGKDPPSFFSLAINFDK